MKDGKATGVYEDFVTGFVASDAGVWGRPVSVTSGPGGALWFSDDAGGAIWHIYYEKK
jgi:glucose/arabinose dehydrogenase